MQTELTTAFKTLLADKVILSRSVEELQTTYRSAKPFPHVVIDGMFATPVLDALLAEMAGMVREQWKRVDNDSRERTTRMKSAAQLGPAGEKFLSIAHSAGFLHLLSEITDIPQLLPDPYLLGSGYAQMWRGDYFSVHTDRNVAYETGLLRRLALIVYLNKSWRPEYHGDLELWNREATRCDATVEPLFNKTVIFEVANPNYHGVPVPLACPADRARQSFILYYHTVAVPGQPYVKPHTSLFAPRTHGTNRVTLRQIAREIVPPVLTRALRKFGRRDDR